jgi:GH25 family lysozyme M1 (1,4-beta-N-acetylmuramidase)
MRNKTYSRRDALALTGSLIASKSLLLTKLARTQAVAIPDEVKLVDEPTRGDYGRYDLDNFGPANQRKVGANFEFPKDVDVDLGYGIDISHYTDEVPWAELASAKVNYIYMKASQSRNGRDDKFVEFWGAAKVSGLPVGAYHFLTAGVPGRDQAQYFLTRLSEVGGLKRGNLQPVIDLEWDFFGPDFKRIILDRTPTGVVYKDYWDTLSKPAIVATVNDCVSAIKSGAGMPAVKPVIYTNRSWWEDHVPLGTVFAGCTVWISDYREASYKNNSPRSVKGHEYYLWQFTDKANIRTSSKAYGPYDSNKLLFGGIDHLKIS